MNKNNSSELKSTPLKDLHLQLDGRMIAFAGYAMPVQYPDGVKTEHLHTRQHAGLFDVSHMGQITITGKGVAKALEALIPVELENLGVNKQIYALLTNDDGGILDDLMIARWAEDCFFLVVNADSAENTQYQKRPECGITYALLVMSYPSQRPEE